MTYFLPLILILAINPAWAEETLPVASDAATATTIASPSETTTEANIKAEDDISSSVNKPEEEQYNVFTPEFMNSLLECKPDVAKNPQNAEVSPARILGKEGDECHLQYADFDFHIPFDILPNIHGFDDLNVLLRNHEITQYSSKPQYLYTGLLHALNACNRGTNYLGAEKTIEVDNKRLTKALEAEVADDVCTIYLVSELEIDNALNDYTVTCRIGTAAIGGLLNYYSDLLDKYGEKRIIENGRTKVISEQENEQTHKADAELMFFLQQKGYCRHLNEM